MTNANDIRTTRTGTTTYTVTGRTRCHVTGRIEGPRKPIGHILHIDAADAGPRCVLVPGRWYVSTEGGLPISGRDFATSIEAINDIRDSY